MARSKLFQLFDLKAGLIAGPIVIERNAGPAIRAFHATLANKDTTPGQYPEDFTLVCLGEQDDESGTVTGYPQPVTIATGQAWKEAQGLPRANALGDGAATSQQAAPPHPRFTIVPEYGERGTGPHDTGSGER